MRTRIITAVSTFAVLIGLSIYSLGRPAQNHEMAEHEPHMSAAMGHLLRGLIGYRIPRPARPRTA